MLMKLFKPMIAIIALFGLSTWIGCGSGNDNSEAVNETNSANVIAIISANQAVVAAIDTGATQNVNCEPSGVADVTGNVSPGQTDTDFNLIIDFTDCTGLNGTLDVVGSGSSNNGNFTFNYSLDGDLNSEGCELTYDDLNIIFEDGTVRLDGPLSAECDSGSVTCNYDNVSITDQQALEDACS